MLGHFELHQLLSRREDALTLKVNIRVELGLAQQLKKSQPQILAHRSIPPFGEVDNPDWNRRWLAASTAQVKKPKARITTRDEDVQCVLMSRRPRCS